jgi:hypothetical protein
MNKPNVFKQWILLLLLSFTLSACFKNEDKDSRVQLPNINPNLSTESPEGIWLLHMDIEATEKHQINDGERTNEDTYFIRQVIRISETENAGEYQLGASCKQSYLPTNNSLAINHTIEDEDFTWVMKQLLDAYGLSDPNTHYSAINVSSTDLPTLWQLTDNILAPNLVPLNQDQAWLLQYQLFQTEIPYFYPFVKQGSKSGSLNLTNNLSLAGSLQLKNMKYLSTENDYQRYMSIKGVKISDSTKFTESEEIDFSIHIESPDVNITETSEILDCLRIAEWNSTVTTTSNNSTERLSYSKHFSTIKFSQTGYGYSDETYFEASINHNTDKQIARIINPVPLDISYTNQCAETNYSECESALSFSLQLESQATNNLSAEADIISHNGNEVKAGFSMSIQH